MRRRHGHRQPRPLQDSRNNGVGKHISCKACGSACLSHSLWRFYVHNLRMSAAFAEMCAILQVHDPSVPNGTLKKLGSVSEFCAEFCKCSLLITKGSGQHD